MPAAVATKTDRGNGVALEASSSARKRRTSWQWHWHCVDRQNHWSIRSIQASIMIDRAEDRALRPAGPLRSKKSAGAVLSLSLNNAAYFAARAGLS